MRTRREPGCRSRSGRRRGGWGGGGDGAAAWTALYHQDAATGLHAVEETPAGRHATASVDDAGVPGAVWLTYPRTGGVCGGIGVCRRQDARFHEPKNGG